MPTVDIDGIVTRCEITGSGPSILMMAPGGFDSAIEKWGMTWPWQHFLPLQALASEYTCIAYDRRDAGQSGGRVERLTWAAGHRAGMSANRLRVGILPAREGHRFIRNSE